MSQNYQLIDSLEISNEILKGAKLSYVRIFDIFKHAAAFCVEVVILEMR